MKKRCFDCSIVKDYSEFHFSGKGYRANCKACRSKKDRRDKLRRHYKITPEHYETLLMKQEGVCRLCKGVEVDRNTRRSKALVVDHDHSCCPGPQTCGECIRGLLCSRCNIVLGMVDDNAGLLLEYVTYLGGNNDRSK